MRRWIERQRHVLDFTLAALARRRGKNLALLLVYAGVVFALASVLFFTQALRREAALVLRDAPEVLVQRLAAGRHELVPARYVEALRGIRGVSDARGRLWGYHFDPTSRANLTVLAPHDFWGRPGEVVIGAGVARARGVAAGDDLWLVDYHGKSRTFAIREVIPAESDLVAADLVLLSEADFRDVFGMEAGIYTDVALTVRNPREVPTVASKVAHLLPDTRPITRDEISRTYEAIFGWRSGLVVAVLTGAVLAFAVVAWDKASGLSAEERREIGILKAVGWDSSDVLLMKLWEGAVISSAAFLAGVLLAYAHVFHAGGALFATVLQGWSTLPPAFRLAPSLDGGELATLFFLTVAPYLAATVVPSWRAATVDPDSVMRA